MKKAFTIKEFSDTYGPSRSKTYELLAEGQISAVKVGSRTFITAESADKWFANLPSHKAA